VLQKSKRVRGSDIDLPFEGLQFESSTPQIPFALEWIPRTGRNVGMDIGIAADTYDGL